MDIWHPSNKPEGIAYKGWYRPRWDRPFTIDSLDDRLWRLNNLYYGITDEEGKPAVRFRFIMKESMFKFWAWMHRMNVLLKARQYGYTTFIALLALDSAIFRPNLRAALIAHTKDDATIILRDKVKFPFENLCKPNPNEEPHAGLTHDQWDALGHRIRRDLAAIAKKSPADELLMANNSSIRVTNSGRSGTVHFLHVSELGKMAAHYPEKAREVKTGALPAAENAQVIIVESTAEGQEGLFYDTCKTAQDNSRQRKTLTRKDWRFHFHPWWDDESRRMSDSHLVITPRMFEYFRKLETKHGIKLDDAQKAWYLVTEAQLGTDMLREHPSTPDEAFQASIEGAYLSTQMAELRERGGICQVPAEDGIAVHTWWDLGMDDANSIVFSQDVGREVHIIDYYENSGEGLPHYKRILDEKAEEFGWIYGQHTAPFDIKVREWGPNKTRWQQAAEAGLVFRDPRMVKRCQSNSERGDGIEASRKFISLCWFAEDSCERLISCLDNYRKEWNEILGKWNDKPLHNWASHGYKAFELLSMNHQLASPAGTRVQRRGGGRKKTAAGWT